MASRCPQRLPFTASISLSTSRSVRCSRDRYSALGLRLGNLAGADCTVHFSLSGATKFKCAVAAISISSGEPTVHLTNLLSAVCERRPDRDKIFETGLVELCADCFLVSHRSIAPIASEALQILP